MEYFPLYNLIKNYVIVLKLRLSVRISLSNFTADENIESFLELLKKKNTNLRNTKKIIIHRLIKLLSLNKKIRLSFSQKKKKKKKKKRKMQLLFRQPNTTREPSESSSFEVRSLNFENLKNFENSTRDVRWRRVRFQRPKLFGSSEKFGPGKNSGQNE